MAKRWRVGLRLHEPLAQRLAAFVQDGTFTTFSEALHSAVREWLEIHEAPALPPKALEEAVELWLAKHATTPSDDPGEHAP